MTNFANYLESQIRDWVFDGTQMDTPNSTIYVALHTGDPGEDGTANEVSTSSTGYSRQGVSSASWDEPNPNEADNSIDISFGPATSSWGTVSHYSVWDAQTGGNCLWQGALDSGTTIETDDEASFNAGDLTFTID